MTTEIKVRIGLEGAQAVQAGAQAAGQALQGLDTSTRKLGSGQQLTGQQTAQLSAQLQDFFIQVQSGGSPMTAFLQQGSQLSAVFGGAGNALKAVASLITPTSVAFGAAAAAVGTLGYAFVRGEQERMAYTRGIVMTGNAAGVTASQLNEMAKAASSYGSNRGQGADVLAQLVSTGQVAAAVLNQASEAAIRLEREGGVAVKDTVKAFADLGKTPAEALKRLNEGQNFLTLSTYKQVKALQDQGKTADAARVAQEAYAKASVDRMKTLESQLGLVEKAWRFMGAEAAAAWQKILNIGRPDTTREQLEAKRADLASRLARGPLNDRPEVVASFEKGNASLRAQILLLAEQAKQESTAAAAQAKRVEGANQAIDAYDKQADAMKRLVEEGRKLAQGMNLEQAGYDSSFIDQMKQLQAAAKAGGLSTDQLNAAIARLIQQQPFAQEALKRVQDLARARADARNKENEAIDAYLEAEEKARRAALDSVKDRITGLEDEARAAEVMRNSNLNLAQAVEVVAIARLREQQARYTEGSEPYLAVEREIEARQRLLQLLAEKRVTDDRAQAAKDAAEEWRQTADDIRTSLTDAFRRAFESGEDFGAAFAKVIEREIKARIATAIAGALADGLLSVVGLSALQAASAGGGGGGSSGAGYVQQAGTLANLYSGASKVYGYGQSAYNWGVGAYGTLTGNLSTSTAAYTSMANSQALAAYGVEGAGATTGGVTGAGSTGAASSSMAAFWVAAAILGAMKASSDYSEGFNSAGSRQVSKDTGVYAFGGYEADRSRLFQSLGMGDRWADILSGSTAVAKLFGRAAPRVESTGISGTLAGGDFTGQAYADILEKGGLFRSDKRYTQLAAVPDEIGRFMDNAAKSVLDQAKNFGKALGLPADELAGVVSDIKIALVSPKDTTAAAVAEAQKANEDAIATALGGYADKLVEGYAAAVKPLAVYGETTVQTIQRVGGAINSVNDVLGALGLQALQTSVEGGKAAVALQNLFGDAATLQQTAGSYLQNYFTDAERAQLALKSIGQALGEVGLAAPTTRAGLRSMVEDLVNGGALMTEAGRQQVAVLFSVADAFAAVVPPARAAADILAERQRLETELLTLQGNTAELRARERAQLDDSNRALYDQIRALEDQKAAAETAAEAARQAAQTTAAAWASLSNGLQQGVASAYAEVQQQVNAARDKITSDAARDIQLLTDRATAVQQATKSLSDALDSAVRQLTGQVTAAAPRDAAKADLQKALADLRLGRSIDVQAVQQAAGTVSRLDTKGYGSRAEYEFAVAGTVALLRDVQSAQRAQTNAQMQAIARQQVLIEAGRDEQLKVLDGQLKAATDAAGSLINIDKGVHSVAEAVDRLGQAMAAFAVMQGQAAPTGMTGQWLNAGGTQVWAAAGGAYAARSTGAGAADTWIRGINGQSFTLEAARQWVQASLQAGDYLGVRNAAVAAGIDSSALDALLGVADGTSLAEALRRHIPGFASGGYHGGGARWVGEVGPELAVTGPERIFSFDQVLAMAGGRRNDGELAALLRQILDNQRALLQHQQAANTVLARNTRQTSKALRTWNVVGMPATAPA